MNRLKKLSHTAIILLFLTLCYSIPVNAAQFKCTRVTDGDTITVTQNGFKSTIRLVGIDAPEKSRKKHEPGQPFSQASTKYLAGMVLNKYVDIVPYKVQTDMIALLASFTLTTRMLILRWSKQALLRSIEEKLLQDLIMVPMRKLRMRLGVLG